MPDDQQPVSNPQPSIEPQLDQTPQTGQNEIDVNSFDQENSTSNVVVEPAVDQTSSVSESPQAPVSEQSIEPVVTPATPPVKKSRKGLKIALIITAAVLLLGSGGGVFAYTMWHESPQKMVTDAIIHAVTAESALYKGNITVSGDGVSAVISFTAKQAKTAGSVDTTIKITAEGATYSVKASGLIDSKGDMYIKAEQLDDIVNAYKTTIGAGAISDRSNAAIDTIVSKIDGTWIKISSDDVATLSESYSKTQECIDTAIAKFKNDSAAIKEISDAYEANQFIMIDAQLGEQNGSVGYALSVDNAKAKAFAAAVRTSSIYTTLNGCDPSISIDDETLTGTKATEKYELWVSKWDHDVTKLVASGTEEDTKYSVTIEPTYTSDVSVTTPVSSTTFTQLIDDVQNLFASSLSE